jgi:hypothetical protein
MQYTNSEIERQIAERIHSARDRQLMRRALQRQIRFIMTSSETSATSTWSSHGMSQAAEH